MPKQNREWMHISFLLQWQVWMRVYTIVSNKVEKVTKVPDATIQLKVLYPSLSFFFCLFFSSPTPQKHFCFNLHFSRPHPPQLVCLPYLPRNDTIILNLDPYTTSSLICIRREGGFLLDLYLPPLSFDHPHQSSTLPRELRKQLSTSNDHTCTALVGAIPRRPFGQARVGSIPSTPHAHASSVTPLKDPKPWPSRSSLSSSCPYSRRHPDSTLASLPLIHLLVASQFEHRGL